MQRWHLFLHLAWLVHCGNAAVATNNLKLLPRDVLIDRQVAEALVVLEAEDHNRSRSFTLTVPSSRSHETYYYRELALRDLQSLGNDNYVTMTLGGYRGNHYSYDSINQDRGIVIVACESNDDDRHDYTNDAGDVIIQGVWDGHGSTGQIVAEYCQEEMPKRILSAIQAASLNDHIPDTDDVSDIIDKIFHDIDQGLSRDVALEGGTTASLVLVHNNYVYLCNTGDSQSWIAGYHEHDGNNSTRVLQRTRLDTPSDPEELQRLLSLGLYVEDNLVYFTHPETKKEYGLKMSRVIGDVGSQGVIATPVVQVYSIEELQKQYIAAYCSTADNDMKAGLSCDPSLVQIFVMSTSDGLVDYLTPDNMSVVMGRAFSSSLLSKSHPLVAAKSIIEHATALWQLDEGDEYRDDMVLVASKVTTAPIGAPLRPF